MGKIFKNMLPYWKWILVIVAFLVMRAFCDLSLPQYTSDIIDVGIMSSGVEHILPEEMTQEDFVSAQLFMTSREKKTFAACYKEPKKDGNYVRNCEEDTLDDMDESLLEPIVMVYQMSQMKESDIDEKAFTGKMGTDGTQVDMKQLMQALAAGQVPDQQILEMRKQVSGQIDAIGSSTLKSMGVTYAISCDKNAGVDVDAIQKHYLWTTGAKMLGFALLMVMAAVVVGYCASRVGASIGRDLRDKTFRNVVQYSNAEMDHFSTASLITRSTNDVQQIQMVTAVFLRMILYAPIIGIGGVIKVAQTHAGMEWVIALAVLVILGFVMLLTSLAMPKFKIMQNLVDRLNLVSREILTGLNVIRAFGREKREEERFDEANRNLTKTQLFTNRVMTFMMPGMMMIMYCITLLIVWVAAKRIDGGYMQVGSMTAFITYTMMIVMAFLMLTAMSIMLPRAAVAAERIDEVIRTESSIEDAKNPEELREHKGVIRFSHVSFRYPGAEADVLEDIDFTAEPGKTTAIIGSTGCGKSTLVNLIPRLYDVTGGSITLDGKDIRRITMKDLRDEIGFVPQKGVLFSGPFASNLRFGKDDASDEEIAKAAEIAQATEFIEAKDDKYETAIAQGGTNVSGGQKQRISLARALLKDPSILILDDTTSAVDMETESYIQSQLKKLDNKCTIFVIAYRISSIRDADLILVMDNGRIIEQGTHEQLVAAGGYYATAFHNQYGEIPQEILNGKGEK